MILHILGGGAGQLAAVRRCRELGITTFVTDMNPDAPGCLEADYSAVASTFDADETAAAAGAFQAETGFNIGALLVTGTDQPVLTAAVTAERLGITYFLTEAEALRVTNKKTMKTMFSRACIPTAAFRFIGRTFSDDEITGLKFPLVVKPLDSQGQRGVYRIESVQQLRGVIDEVLSYSRCSEVLVEEYFPSDEITLSGWLENGRLHILSVTDRVTVENPPSIGVCVAHHYPSKYAGRISEIKAMTERIIEAAGLTAGPLYFQFLVGRSGKIIVNEIACRLGGAYEDEFIPLITGIDILDVMIRMSCGMKYDAAPFEKIAGAASERPSEGVVSLQMFFCREGRIKSLSGMEQLPSRPGIHSGRYLLGPGTLIRSRRNSTQRAGYFIIFCRSRREADETAVRAYGMLNIYDENGRNMIQFYDKMLFGGE